MNSYPLYWTGRSVWLWVYFVFVFIICFVWWCRLLRGLTFFKLSTRCCTRHPNEWTHLLYSFGLSLEHSVAIGYLLLIFFSRSIAWTPHSTHQSLLENTLLFFCECASFVSNIWFGLYQLKTCVKIFDNLNNRPD